tara:strand:- start:503 stop:991 length:489 start_codon:yes stop_codon:yes gene_type:complete
MNNFTVPDICDAFADEIKVGDIFFHSFGGVDKFCGEIRTANCPHSNSIVKEMVEEDGDGKVLVINHSGQKLCSMVGDQIAQKAFENNWNGIFVNGYIRDIEIIRNIFLGVYAKSPFPMKTDKSVGIGTKDQDIKIGTVAISSGDWIYVDTNGWVVSSKKLKL